MVDSTKEMAYGAAAGCVGKIIEFPFDTVKVRLQSSHKQESTVKMLRHILVKEGIFNGFYKGIRAPLVGACMESAVLFSAYQYGQQGLRAFTLLSLDSLTSVCTAGAFSGFAASFVLTPVELVKCKLQVANLQTHTSHASYGLVVKTVLRNEGVGGLWHGLSSTLVREMAGTAVWFASYEQCQKFLKKTWPDHENTNLLLSGAAAGFLFNLSIYPVDTIKSNIQTADMMSHSQSKLTVTSAFKLLTSRKGGIRNLYNGLGITLMRSIPANAAIFYTYEYLKTEF